MANPPPADTVDMESSANGLPVDYWQSLVQYAEEEREEPPLGHMSWLQRMNLTHLLNEIVRIKGNVQHNRTTSADQMECIRERLHQYADAIRDYKFITDLDDPPYLYAIDRRISLECAFPDLAHPYPNTENHPYSTTYRTLRKKIVQPKDPVRDLLRKALPRGLSWTEAERRARRVDYTAGMTPEVYSKFLDVFARFVIGTAGGCSLIVPMVVMVLHASLRKSLVTTSVALVLFALFLGLVFETSNKDTITATGTYAAVLVVFVGTSGSANNQVQSKPQ